MAEQFPDSGRRGRAGRVSRRAFGQLLVGATAVPLFVPARLLGAPAAAGRDRLADRSHPERVTAGPAGCAMNPIASA